MFRASAAATMTVVQSGPLRAAWSGVSSWFLGGMPWTGIALAALVVLAAAIVVVARKRATRVPVDHAPEQADGAAY